MNSNDCIKQVHTAIVAKAKEKAKCEGNNKFALEVSGKIAEYGSAWATAFGNDGVLDDEEERLLISKFNAIIDLYVPSTNHAAVSIAWSGAKILFWKPWKGLKYYLRTWFGLELK